MGYDLSSDGRILEGYAVFAKPGTFCGNNVCEGSENKNNCPQDCGNGGSDGGTDTGSCYGYLGNEAKWKSVEPYLIDPSNDAGLSDAFISDNIASDILKWENAAGADILGNEILGVVDRNNIGNLNDKNEVNFADISSKGAIAVTIVWGIYALIVLILGLRMNFGRIRTVAMGTLLIVVGKLFLVDLTELETILGEARSDQAN